MSRYQKQIGTKLYAWGIDQDPLIGYFFDLEDSSVKKNDGVIFNLGRKITFQPHPTTPTKKSYNRSEILELMIYEEQQIGEEIVPEDHKTAIATDQMF